VDVLERLLALQERWEATQARKAFDSAMAALRADLPTIVKRQAVDFPTAKGRTSYRYEDLSAVTEAVSPAMAQHGLSFRWQTDSTVPGAIAVTCIVSHAGGHAERTTLSCKADDTGNKNDIQAIGSAVTYLQRYTLKAALGIAAAADDDGRSRAASTRPPAPAPPAKPSEVAPARPDVGTAAGTVLTLAQRQRLVKIITTAGRDPKVVAMWLTVKYGVHSLAELQAADYDAVVTAVERPGSLTLDREVGSEG